MLTRRATLAAAAAAAPVDDETPATNALYLVSVEYLSLRSLARLALTSGEMCAVVTRALQEQTLFYRWDFVSRLHDEASELEKEMDALREEVKDATLKDEKIKALGTKTESNLNPIPQYQLQWKWWKEMRDNDRGRADEDQDRAVQAAHGRLISNLLTAEEDGSPLVNVPLSRVLADVKSPFGSVSWGRKTGPEHLYEHLEVVTGKDDYEGKSPCRLSALCSAPTSRSPIGRHAARIARAVAPSPLEGLEGRAQ